MKKMKKCTARDDTSSSSAAALRDGGTPHSCPQLRVSRYRRKLDKIENLQGRTDLFHDHFKELFTDPLLWETPEWTWQCWPREVPQSLPRMDSQRVWEVAFFLSVAAHRVRKITW